MFKRLLTLFRAEKTPAEREAELVGKLFIALGQSQLALAELMKRTEALSETVRQQDETLTKFEGALAERDRNVNDLSASLEMERELTAKLGTNYETLTSDHINLQAGLAVVREQRDNAQRRAETFKEQFDGACAEIKERMDENEKLTNENILLLGDSVNMRETLEEFERHMFPAGIVQLAAECLDRNSIVKRTNAEPAIKEN